MHSFVKTAKIRNSEKNRGGFNNYYKMGLTGISGQITFLSLPPGNPYENQNHILSQPLPPLRERSL
jgi:hypothetical protein